MYLVTHGQFQSRDKDGGHTIRSSMAEKTTLHANLMALSELLLVEVLVLTIALNSMSMNLYLPHWKSQGISCALESGHPVT